jgi:hypothetical protein
MSDPQEHAVRRGGCQCGAVRYELNGPIVRLVICHCNECRKQSASAFGVSAFVARRDLRVTQGTPKFWSRPTDSGNVLECAFCPECGSRLWHQRAGGADTITVKGGSLDEPVDLTSAVHIWTSRKQQGIVVPQGARQFAKNPDA